MVKIVDEVFNDYKGVVLFLVVVAVLSLLFTMRIKGLNDVANTETVKTYEKYYA